MIKRQNVLAWCTNAIYWEIILIPFVASFSSAAVEIFTGLLILSFLIKRGLSKERTKTFLDVPLALLIIISLLSIVNSVRIASSIQGIFKLLKYGFLIVIIASELKDKEHLKKVIYSALFGLLLSSLDGIYQFIFGVDFFRHKPFDMVIGLKRLKAAFPHTNIFAGYLALFVPVGLAVFRYNSKGKLRIYLGLVLAASLFCLIFTFSRSAVFGVWLVVLIIAFIKKDKLLAVFLIGSVLIAPFLLPKSIHNWAKETKSVGEMLLNSTRFTLYETSFNMMKHHPIVGVGVNTYSLNYQKYKLHDTSEETADTSWYAHNSFLQMASEIGIFGFLIFLYLLFKLSGRWLAFYRKAQDSFLQTASLGMIMGILAFLVHGLTETNLYYPKIAILFWFEVALLTGLVSLKDTRR